VLASLSRPIHLIYLQNLNQLQQALICLQFQVDWKPFCRTVKGCVNPLFGTVQQFNCFLVQLIIVMCQKPYAVVLSALDELVCSMRKIYVICNMSVYHWTFNHLQTQVHSKLQSWRIAAYQEFSGFCHFFQEFIWNFDWNHWIELMPELRDLLRNRFFSHVLKRNDLLDQQN
jgi:hypothetical protein